MTHSRQPGRFSPGLWLLELRDAGLIPIMHIVEVIEKGYDWTEAEKRHISRYRQLFPDLLNRADGGLGPNGCVFSADVRNKLSAARKGRSLAPEHAEKISLALTGKPKSAAHIANWRKAMGLDT